MRPVVASALVLAILLSGCVIRAGGEEERAGGPSGVSETCINGMCRTCRDGVCTGALAELEKEAAGPHPDVAVQETHDLTTGLATTAWTFWVAPDATGHVVLRMVDAATGERSANPHACFAWERLTPSSRSSGGSGSCGNTGNVQLKGLEPFILASWDSLAWGRYTLTVSAPPQANELTVDIVVDNPE